jgi:hypothetical protein
LIKHTAHGASTFIPYTFYQYYASYNTLYDISPLFSYFKTGPLLMLLDITGLRRCRCFRFHSRRINFDVKPPCWAVILMDSQDFHTHFIYAICFIAAISIVISGWLRFLILHFRIRFPPDTTEHLYRAFATPPPLDYLAELPTRPFSIFLLISVIS